MMPSNVEKASEIVVAHKPIFRRVVGGFISWRCAACEDAYVDPDTHQAQALAEEGLLIPDNAETTAQYGVQWNNGRVEKVRDATEAFGFEIDQESAGVHPPAGWAVHRSAIHTPWVPYQKGGE
jgi:hypothetical protein